MTISTDSTEQQSSLFINHVREDGHKNNVMNYVFSKVCPSIWEINNPYKIINQNSVFCITCEHPVCGITDIEKTIQTLKDHTLGIKHQEKLLNTQLKTIETSNVDQPVPSSSTSLPVTSILCSVCELSLIHI